LTTAAEPTQTFDAEIRALYQEILDGWNRHNGAAMAGSLADDAEVVGFDGSQILGRQAVISEMDRIFASHETAAYVGKVRRVVRLGQDAALLRAVAGMVPPGHNDINPAVNTIHSLVAARRGGRWRVIMFQSTPAQFHGRPDLAEALTDELRQLLPVRNGG
jgi:uncharacterized protein (TIGR02246 family)